MSLILWSMLINSESIWPSRVEAVWYLLGLGLFSIVDECTIIGNETFCTDCLCLDGFYILKSDQYSV